MTASGTPSNTPSPSATLSVGAAPSITATGTGTAAISATATRTSTATPTPSASNRVAPEWMTYLRNMDNSNGNGITTPIQVRRRRAWRLWPAPTRRLWIVFPSFLFKPTPF